MIYQNQHRNKTMFWLICSCFSQIYNNFKSIVYNYSEAGHGKTAADGVGALIKRTADKLVAFGNDANNFDVLFNLLRENLQSH